MRVYVGGSLRNPRILTVTKKLNAAGFDAFSGWFGAGPEADDHWQRYEKGLGHTYRQALAAPAAQTIYKFDIDQIDLSDAFVLVYPAGKSSHAELGYAKGTGKLTFVLMKEPKRTDRWDLMLNIAHGIAYTVEELVEMILVKTIMSDARADYVAG